MADISKFLVKDDKDYVNELGALDSRTYLASPLDLLDRVWESIAHPETGLRMPWPECDLVQFVPRRWSVWSGKSFSGKSQLLRMLMLHALQRGQRVMIASPEEDPWEYLRELVYLAAARRVQVTEAFVEFCLAQWNELLWIFTPTGFIDPFKVLGAMCYVAKNYGLDQGVIDSLMKLDIRKDDLDGQRHLANTLDRVVRQHNLHIHLVAHPAKDRMRRDQLLTMDDIGGAHDLTSQAHSVVILERLNHDPAGKAMREKFGIAENVDSLFRALKQRGDHNYIGSVPLYYDRPSRQWKYNPSDQLIRPFESSVYRFCEMLEPEQEAF